MLEPEKEYFIVNIGFKNGKEITCRFSEFKLKTNGYTWNSAPNNKYPLHLLTFVVDDVEYVTWRKE